jgi:hypothetical protein
LLLWAGILPVPKLAAGGDPQPMADDFEKAVLITFNYGGNIDLSLKVKQHFIWTCVAGSSWPKQYCTSSSTWCLLSWRCCFRTCQHAVHASEPS